MLQEVDEKAHQWRYLPAACCCCKLYVKILWTILDCHHILNFIFV